MISDKVVECLTLSGMTTDELLEWAATTWMTIYVDQQGFEMGKVAGAIESAVRKVFEDTGAMNGLPSIVQECMDSTMDKERLIQDASMAKMTGDLQTNLTRTIVQSISTETRSMLDKLAVIEARTKSESDRIVQAKENSSMKGASAEALYGHLFNTMSESIEVTYTGKESHSMDFLLEDNNKPPIMVDVKHYKVNVPTREVTKFIEDIKTNKKHGIMISHASGISMKKSFKFEIIEDSYVALYLSNVDASPDTVRGALDFVYSIASFLDSCKDDADNLIVRPEEFAEWVIALENHVAGIEVLRKTADDMKRQIERLATIDDLLWTFKNTLPGHFVTDARIAEETANEQGPGSVKVHCPVCNKELVSAQSAVRHLKSKHEIPTDEAKAMLNPKKRMVL